MPDAPPWRKLRLLLRLVPSTVEEVLLELPGGGLSDYEVDRFVQNTSWMPLLRTLEPFRSRRVYLALPHPHVWEPDWQHAVLPHVPGKFGDALVCIA